MVLEKRDGIMMPNHDYWTVISGGYLRHGCAYFVYSYVTSFSLSVVFCFYQFFWRWNYAYANVEFPSRSIFNVFIMIEQMQSNKFPLEIIPVCFLPESWTRMHGYILFYNKITHLNCRLVMLCQYISRLSTSVLVSLRIENSF